MSAYNQDTEKAEGLALLAERGWVPFQKPGYKDLFQDPTRANQQLYWRKAVRLQMDRDKRFPIVTVVED